MATPTFSSQHQVGQREYSSDMANYLNALSPDQLISMGDNFDISGLARSDLASINPYGATFNIRKSDPNELPALSYRPEELQYLSKYRNIDHSLGGSTNPYGSKFVRQYLPSQGHDDSPEYEDIELWGTRNQGGGADDLYQVNDGNFSHLKYDKPNSNWAKPIVIGGMAALTGAGLAAGLGAFGGAAAGAGGTTMGPGASLAAAESAAGLTSAAGGGAAALGGAAGNSLNLVNLLKKGKGIYDTYNQFSSSGQQQGAGMQQGGTGSMGNYNPYASHDNALIELPQLRYIKSRNTPGGW
jgi:hypothetical protein